MCRQACALMIGLMLACDSGSDDPEDATPRAGHGGAGTQAGAGAGARAGSEAGSGSGGRGASGAGAGGAGAAGAGGDGSAADGGAPPDASIDDAGEPTQLPVRVQVFSRTLGFRHESIEPAQNALRGIAQRQKIRFEFTEDPVWLIARLSQTDVVVFLMTTGDVLDAAQQTSFERFIREGGGYVGVHSAADTEYDWPFYGSILAGGWFKDHPAVQQAKIVVDAPQNPLVSFLPAIWQRSDEWYNFRENPRGKADVLLRLDESSYSGGNMGADHPIAWSHSIDKGRAFYTGLGHTNESWQEANVVQHVERALLWAAGRSP